MCLIMLMYLYGISIGTFGFSWWYAFAALIADVIWISVLTSDDCPISIKFDKKK